MGDKAAPNSTTRVPATGLRVVDDAVELARDIHAAVRTIRGHRDLVDQLTRATESSALNLAEGAGRNGRDKNYHYNIAYGSAGEASTAISLLGAYGELQPDTANDFIRRFDRLRAISWRLNHSR